MAARSDHGGQAEQLVTVGHPPAGALVPPTEAVKVAPRAHPALCLPRGTENSSSDPAPPQKRLIKVRILSLLRSTSPPPRREVGAASGVVVGKREGLGRVPTTWRRGVLKMSRCQLGRGGCEDILAGWSPLESASESAGHLLKPRWQGPTPELLIHWSG